MLNTAEWKWYGLIDSEGRDSVCEQNSKESLQDGVGVEEGWGGVHEGGERWGGVEAQSQKIALRGG